MKTNFLNFISRDETLYYYAYLFLFIRESMFNLQRLSVIISLLSYYYLKYSNKFKNRYNIQTKNFNSTYLLEKY